MTLLVMMRVWLALLSLAIKRPSKSDLHVQLLTLRWSLEFRFINWPLP